MTVVNPEVNQLREQLRNEQDNVLMLIESLADLELAMEDKGWTKLGSSGTEFSVGGRQRIAEVCRAQAVANPLLKSGLNIRIGYIWGQGVEIQAKDEDVNEVIQRFLNANQKQAFGSQAREELERSLGTDGEIYRAAFTLPLTGAVQIRSTPASEIQEIITNPDDRDDVWYYVREYTGTSIQYSYLGAYTKTGVIRELHPDINYWPTQRPRTIDGLTVRWDAPIQHVPVNRLDGWKHGVPDVYASVAWARMYREFLVDWAALTKSLSKLAFQATGDTKSRAALAASSARAMHAATEAGGTQVNGPGIKYEAVSKSGATIDAESGKPLAGMVAAGLGLPVTQLLGDPGITGARATAETLDLPTQLGMAMRRLLWQAKDVELLNYVIDQSVLAPRGELSGTLDRDDWGKLVVTLPDEDARTMEFEWPPMQQVDPVSLITAIVSADSTGKLPDLVIVKALLNAMGVKDIDEIIKENTDDQDRWIRPEPEAGQAAVDAFNRGDDPAAATR